MCNLTRGVQTFAYTCISPKWLEYDVLHRTYMLNQQSKVMQWHQESCTTEGVVCCLKPILNIKKIMNVSKLNVMVLKYYAFKSVLLLRLVNSFVCCFSGLKREIPYVIFGQVLMLKSNLCSLVLNQTHLC